VKLKTTTRLRLRRNAASLDVHKMPASGLFRNAPNPEGSARGICSNREILYVDYDPNVVNAFRTECHGTIMATRAKPPTIFSAGPEASAMCLARFSLACRMHSSMLARSCSWACGIIVALWGRKTTSEYLLR